MTSKILVATAALGMIASSAFAQKNLSLTGPGTRIEPIRVAKARLVNGQVKIIGNWKTLNERPAVLSTMHLGIFDAAEQQAADGFPTGLRYGIDNSTGAGNPAEGSRWWFGPDYGNTAACGNFTVKKGYKGLTSDILGFQWAQTDGDGDGITGGDTYPTLIAVFTAEDFDDTGAGPAFDNAFDGVVYDFGDVPDAGPTGGYYFAGVIEIAGAGLFHQMPADGTGAVLWLHGTDDGFGGFALNTTGIVQPMLWGSEAAGTFPASPGTRSEWQWDDDNPRDGSWSAPAELYSYAFGISPDPLGAAIGFYGHDAVVVPDEVVFANANTSPPPAGGAAEVEEDDNTYAEATRGFAPSLIEDVPKINCTGGNADYAAVRTTSGGPGYATGKVNVVAKADKAIRLRTYIQNKVNSAYVLIDEIVVSANVEVNRTTNLTGTIDNYVDANGKATVRIGGNRAPTTLGSFWRIYVDKVRTTFTAAP